MLTRILCADCIIGVFTELIDKIGVKGVLVEEVYTLEDAPSVNPCYGLIFLFQWQKSEQKDTRPVLNAADCPEIFFASQTVQNACATQAILSILLNRDDIDLPDELSMFKQFAIDMSPDVRGDLIGQQELIRTVHNSFTQPDPFDIELVDAHRRPKQKAYHFVAYVPINGKVYELDGLRAGPIMVGEGVTDDTWTAVAANAISDRVKRFGQANLDYALLSLVPDPSDELAAKVMSLQGEEGHEKALAQAQADLAAHEAKLQAYHRENIQRRHNYVPLIIHLCKELAKANKLVPLLAASEAATKRKRDAAEARKKASSAAPASATSTSSSSSSSSATPQDKNGNA